MSAPDLLTALADARARVAAQPENPAAWLALAEILRVADLGARDRDAAFALAGDRWDALCRLAALQPTADNLAGQVQWGLAVAHRAEGRGDHEVALGVRRECCLAARVWMYADPAPERAAELLLGAASQVAEVAITRGERVEAARSLGLALEAAHLLAARTGRPEHALRIAGLRLHLATVCAPEGVRGHLLAAREVLDRLDAAGLTHPVQAQVRAEVEARLVGLEGS